MDKYKDLNKQYKRSARQDKQDSAEKKAMQGETELVSGQVKDVFANFRSLRAACPRKVSHILDKHSNLVSDKAAKAEVERTLRTVAESSSSSSPDLSESLADEDQACESSLAEVHAAVQRQNTTPVWNHRRNA